MTSGNDVETYVGCTTNSATKYYKHKTDCNNPKYKNGTTLSTYVCQYKMEDNRQGEPLQPHQQSVSSPYQGVLLYTFQEGHGILEQTKIRFVSQLCAQAFRFTHESLKPHPFMYNLGSQLSNFIRVFFCNMLTLLYNLYM